MGYNFIQRSFPRMIASGETNKLLEMCEGKHLDPASEQRIEKRIAEIGREGVHVLAAIFDEVRRREQAAGSASKGPWKQTADHLAFLRRSVSEAMSDHVTQEAHALGGFFAKRLFDVFRKGPPPSDDDDVIDV